jgi:hypothetical protein
MMRTGMVMAEEGDPAGAGAQGVAAAEVEAEAEGTFFIPFQAMIALMPLVSGRDNPGNNLHVSGLTHKVDNRDLETAFAKVGRVRILSPSCLHPLFTAHAAASS